MNKINTILFHLFIIFCFGGCFNNSSSSINDEISDINESKKKDTLNSQERFLLELAIDNNSYEFYFFYQNNDYREDESLPLIKPFMINDKSKLKKLRKYWFDSKELDGFKREMPAYIVYIVHNDSIIGHLNALDYNEHDYLLYDTIQTNISNVNPYPAGIEGDFDVYETIIETDTVTQSRLLADQLAKMDNVYDPKGNFDWIKFDGRFKFSICSKGIKSLRKINNLEDVIYSKFKNNEFIIFFGVLSPSEYLGQIICNESFYNEIKNNIPEWDDFEFTIPEYGKWQPWHLTTLGDGITTYLFSTDKNKLDYLEKMMKVD